MLIQKLKLLYRYFIGISELLATHKLTCLTTLDAGLLARCQCSEGPATGHLDTGFLSWFPCVFKANAEKVPQFPS
jgi:hypothetical protein